MKSLNQSTVEFAILPCIFIQVYSLFSTCYTCTEFRDRVDRQLPIAIPFSPRNKPLAAPSMICHCASGTFQSASTMNRWLRRHAPESAKWALYLRQVAHILCCIHTRKVRWRRLPRRNAFATIGQLLAVYLNDCIKPNIASSVRQFVDSPLYATCAFVRLLNGGSCKKAADYHDRRASRLP